MIQRRIEIIRYKNKIYLKKIRRFLTIKLKKSSLIRKKCVRIIKLGNWEEINIVKKWRAVKINNFSWKKRSHLYKISK